MRENSVQMMEYLEVFCEVSAQHQSVLLLIVPASKLPRGSVSPFSCGMEPANP